MKRYEFKVVKVGGSWLGGASTQSALVELLNREGRSGWFPVQLSENLTAWHRVLLQREAD